MISPWGSVGKESLKYFPSDLTLQPSEDRLHNLQGPVQNESVGLAKKTLKNFKTATEHQTKSLCNGTGHTDGRPTVIPAVPPTATSSPQTSLLFSDLCGGFKSALKHTNEDNGLNLFKTHSRYLCDPVPPTRPPQQ